MLFSHHDELPPHCEPVNPFLTAISSAFGTCIPTPLALLSTLLGILSILSWLFAQVPQIIKNFQLHSTSGLSALFLLEWLLGDLSNLIGSIFTQQASWQVILASYYCTVDCVLCGQWLWYEHFKHGWKVRRVKWWKWVRGTSDAAIIRPSKNKKPAVLVDGLPVHQVASGSKPIAAKGKKALGDETPESVGSWKPSSLLRMPQFQFSFSSSASTLSESPSSSGRSQPRPITRAPRPESPTPSPRTVLYISLLLAIVAQASPTPTPSSSPLHTTIVPTPTTVLIGQLASWLSTLLYLSSRLPQLLHNYMRRSTAGLSPTLFLAAFCGNFFYSTSLITNPCLWSSFGPHGGRGWVGPHGSDRYEWALRAAPFFLGAAGVLLMDGAVGVQFLMYSREGKEAAVLVVEEPDVRGIGRWRRVSGWMRGWVPGATPKNKDGLLAGNGWETETDGETESLLSAPGTPGGSTPRPGSPALRNYGTVR